jgi:sugar phosphate isomerase/epimerase
VITVTTRTITNRDLLATVWTWSGNTGPAIGDETSPLDIRSRLAAVQKAGWTGVGFVHSDLMKIVEAIGVRALKTLLDDHGITTVELEFISNWWADGALREASDAVRADLFAAASVLGTTAIKVGAELQSFGVEHPVTPDRFRDSFDALATDAAAHGLRVAVEPMPMSNIATITAGADLVREIANPAAGLVVDTWHVRRGGTDYQTMIDALPMEHVFVVELDDADADVVGTLWDDTVNNRRMPGDGALDTAAFVAALHDAGWRGHWGVEIISRELRALPVDEGVQRVHDKTIATLDRAEHVPAFTIAPRA